MQKYLQSITPGAQGFPQGFGDRGDESKVPPPSGGGGQPGGDSFDGGGVSGGDSPYRGGTQIFAKF